VSTTNTSRRFRTATLVVAGTTLGLTVSGIILRQERKDIPSTLIAAMVGTLAFAVVCAIVWRSLPAVDLAVLPPKRRPAPRPIPAGPAASFAGTSLIDLPELSPATPLREIESSVH
jgi:hypothetical protein